jgi:Uma2 family endonuclease
MSAPAPTLTIEELLALDDGIDRELIRGELREYRAEPGEPSRTVRSRWHSRLMSRIDQILSNWLESLPEPRGEIASGEAGFQLTSDPNTLVGIDVAYASAEVVANTPPTARFYAGIPVLAVEILSPSDSQERINEKIDLYRETGVPLIWIVDPALKTILVLRAGEEPELFNIRQELAGAPELPGFRVAVADVFRF